MPKKIFSIGCQIPGNDVEYVSFSDDRTLLDADIILFRPILPGDYSEQHMGKHLLTERSSFKAKERLAHWHSELGAAAAAGKMIIVFLAAEDTAFAYTGERQFSGTGRNRSTTNIVSEISSYQALPFRVAVTNASGAEVKLAGASNYLAAYWHDIGKHSQYEVYLSGQYAERLLVTRSGDRTVGAAIEYQGGGIVLLLPPIDLDRQRFIKNEKWTSEALQFGKRYVAAICALADAIRRESAITPAPVWSAASEYRLPSEHRIELEIVAVRKEIEKQQKRKLGLESELTNAAIPRDLLFEQGARLETAVLHALKCFGFKAEPFDDGDSEFDAVFTSPEGRCLGEAEGKDNKAINIDKQSQLERNLQEDFARDEVSEHAKGVLFGNAYRLQPIADRGPYFTEKCTTAAKRSKVALVRTPDMFASVKYLAETSDADYAAKCRQAIFAAEGTIVEFPIPPIVELAAQIATEQKNSGDDK